MIKENKIWVIVVDPFKKEVIKQKINNDLTSIKKLINLDDSELVESVRLYDYPVTYVLCDENGRLKSGDKRYVEIKNIVYTGKCVIIGLENHEFASCNIKMEYLSKIIDFKNRDYIDDWEKQWGSND